MGKLHTVHLYTTYLHNISKYLQYISTLYICRQAAQEVEIDERLRPRPRPLRVQEEHHRRRGGDRILSQEQEAFSDILASY